MRNSQNSRLWLILSVLVVFCDQASKILAEKWLIYAKPCILTSFFNLTLVYNNGSAFSLLSQQSGWQRWFLSTLAFLVSIFILFSFYRNKNMHPVYACSLSLVLGGAIGNLMDRMRYGYVIDFIQWHYHDYYWPVFNLADCAIVIGSVLLCYMFMKKEI